MNRLFLLLVILTIASAVNAQEYGPINALVLLRPSKEGSATISARTSDVNSCLAYGRAVVYGLQSNANVACLDINNHLLISQNCGYMGVGTSPQCITLPPVNLECNDPKTASTMGCLQSAAPTTPGYTNGVPNSILDAGKPAGLNP